VIKLSPKIAEYYFVETDRTPTATIAAIKTMTQASVTSTTGIVFFTIVDNLQLLYHGQEQIKYKFWRISSRLHYFLIRKSVKQYVECYVAETTPAMTTATTNTATPSSSYMTTGCYFRLIQ